MMVNQQHNMKAQEQEHLHGVMLLFMLLITHGAFQLRQVCCLAHHVQYLKIKTDGLFTLYDLIGVRRPNKMVNNTVHVVG